ncbi:WD domain, G-beta repeat protein [Rhizoctonia solani AG-3 Rhs1AP]|uniref:WD domain, G-beta repeat protein n=2 Tax=Rhizoctonia solani AG-3 TaxID=1086053 RepID=A0A074REX8_9AGAM|nr:WD domain, G-beta repeat protein [Rhizoctonia solani AG-3 Rhs1AP]KEP45676.1 WD domain, G-beta repeat protein [Rhizoctonia solani 123E]
MRMLTTISRHNGLIKHLAFSPDQTLLATCGWDGMAVVSNADEIKTPKFNLKHTNEEAPTELQPFQNPLFGKNSAGELRVREVAWSPDSTMLATRTRTKVWVWNMKDGTLLGSIQVGRGRSIKSIAWSWKVETIKPVNNAPEQTHWQSKATLKPQTKILEKSQILVVIGHTYEPTGTYVIHYDYSKLQGTQSTQDMRAFNKETPIENMMITSMATVNDCSIPDAGSFGVSGAKNATMPATNNPNTLTHHSNSMVNDDLLIGVGVDTKNNPNIEAEQFLFLYNFISGEFLCSSPLSGKVHNVSVTVPKKNVAHVLVTYTGQAAYPQLWEIKVRPDRKQYHIVRIRTYFSGVTSNFSGRGCFGGPDDIYVCCSSRDSKIFIWNRETGVLLSTILHVGKEQLQLKSFTCNKLAGPEFLCAFGAMNGILGVWSTRNVERASSAYSIPLDSDQQHQPILSSPEPLFSEEEYTDYI